jgi:redox-sensitive bicupin YhaK (pirin superfamily)
MSDTLLEGWIAPRRSEITPGFFVGRVLPFRGGRGVGPFVFLDHMGPHTFARGSDSDVLPHPHIGLATVTYLFDGEIEHRDSLGSVQRIRPGDVNWMTAGKGIVHSERAPPERRDVASTMHGLQAWVALPIEHEEIDPTFEHRERTALPSVELDGVRHRLIAGSAFGMRSPVRALSRLFYVHSELPAGTRLRFDSEGQEAAFYLVEGEVEFEGRIYAEPGLLHFKPGSAIEIVARRDSRGMLLGGDPLGEHRRIWWNFVSSRPERIEAAKRLWKAEGFPRIPGEIEFVPLPE